MATVRRARWSRCASWSSRNRCSLLAGTLGTPPNSAIHKYVNAKDVPHIFVNTGATKWGDPKNFPWTMGFNLNYQAEGHIYAQYILDNKPDAKIADPLPERRLRQGLRQGLEGRTRRQGGEHDRGRGQLRGHRSDGRFADRHLKASGADVMFTIRDAQVCRAVHPQGCRYRLAAAALSSTTWRLRSEPC